MLKKRTYYLLSILSVFAICLGSVQRAFAFTETQTKKEQKDNEEDEQELSAASTLEATVPSLGFNINADLFFVFEVLLAFNENPGFNLTFSSDLLISYWINLFSYTIVVNAP